MAAFSLPLTLVVQLGVGWKEFRRGSVNQIPEPQQSLVLKLQRLSSIPCGGLCGTVGKLCWGGAAQVTLLRYGARQSASWQFPKHMSHM